MTMSERWKGRGREVLEALKLRLTELRRSSNFLFLSALLCLSVLTLISTSHASGAELSIVHGEVVDAVTGEPLVNATILVWGVSNSQCTLKATTTTDTNGYYEVHLPRGFRYRIYTYHDKPESPGLDHLPALQSFYLGEETKIKIQFRLFPAASILFKGDIHPIGHRA